MDIQLAHLRTLYAVVRHGSFSRAAEEIHLTQPAVSKQIRQLERIVGAPLLERVGKRAYPNRAAELLLAHAGRALDEIEAGLEGVRQLGGRIAGRIRLGTNQTSCLYLLPPVFRGFRARYPQVELIVSVEDSSEIIKAVVANELDLGVVTLPALDRALVSSPLFRGEVVAIAPPGAIWRRKRSITARELAQHPMILYEHAGRIVRGTRNWFERGGVNPQPLMRIDSTEVIKNLVSVGLGVSVMDYLAVHPAVKAGRLAAVQLDPPLLREMGIIRRRDKPVTPLLATFLAALDDLRKSLQASGSGRAAIPPRRR